MRRFGIEVEYVGSNSDVISAIYDVGLSSRRSISSYMGHSDDEWVVKTDASVSNGGELVSPPLDFDDDGQRAQVSTAIQALLAQGCRPDDTTGIHVHVDCSDLTVKQLSAVVKNFYKYEDIIYRIACSGRTTMRRGARHYAPPIREDQALAIAKAKQMRDLTDAWYGRGANRGRSHGDQSRYCGINLHSYFYRGTIEFRVFNSSMNSERVQAYVAMCMALVEDARRGNSRSVNRRYALGAMYSGELKEANAWHRFIQVLRYEAGLSLVDMKRLTKVWKDSAPQPNFMRSY